jgi:hypothetical protein
MALVLPNPAPPSSSILGVLACLSLKFQDLWYLIPLSNGLHSRHGHYYLYYHPTKESVMNILSNRRPKIAECLRRRVMVLLSSFLAHWTV